MTTFNALDLIPTVAAIRGDVLANRERCKTGLAYTLHDALVEKLDEVTADLRLEVATEQRLAAERGTQDGDEWYEIYHICTWFERKWCEDGPISLLDRIFAYVAVDGESCRVGLDYTTVPDSELEGLAEIIDTIRRKTYIEFVAARV